MRMNEERRRALEAEDYAREEEIKRAYEELRKDASKVQQWRNRAREVFDADAARRNVPPYPSVYKKERDRLILDEEARKTSAMAEHDRKNPKPKLGFFGREGRWNAARKVAVNRETKASDQKIAAFDAGKEREREANRREAEKRYAALNVQPGELEAARRDNRIHRGTMDLTKDDVADLGRMHEAKRVEESISPSDAKVLALTDREARLSHLEFAENRVSRLEGFTDKDVLPDRDRTHDDRFSFNIKTALDHENRLRERFHEFQQKPNGQASYREQNAIPVDKIQGIRNHQANDNRSDPCAIAEGMGVLRGQRAAMSEAEGKKHGAGDERAEFEMRYDLEKERANLGQARAQYEHTLHWKNARRVMEAQFSLDYKEAQHGAKLWNTVAEREKEMFGATATHTDAIVKKEACEKAVSHLAKRREEISRGEGIPEDIYVNRCTPFGNQTERVNGFRADEDGHNLRSGDEEKERRFKDFCKHKANREALAETENTPPQQSRTQSTNEEERVKR